MIIIVSGISGSRVYKLGKNISQDLGLKLISYKNYQKEEYLNDENNYITLSDGTKVLDVDNENFIDWDRLNEDIYKEKKGVVVVTEIYPITIQDAKIEIDFHINIKLSKQNLMLMRNKYVEKHRNLFKGLSLANEQLYFNKHTYPYYLRNIEDSKITKFINANEHVGLAIEEYDDKLYDEAFDYLMAAIDKWLQNYSRRKNETN